MKIELSLQPELDPEGVGVLKIIIFSMFFWNPLLGGLWELILVILEHFWGPFWRPFWSLFGYHFCIDF